MNQKKGWKRYWKAALVLCALVIIAVTLFFTSGMDGVVSNYAQAYADTSLYEKALEQVREHPQATTLLGDIEPLEQLSIVEGSVQYSNDNQTVHTTVRIKGTKGTAKMDIAAHRVDAVWEYETIQLRVKDPQETTQTIEIITAGTYNIK